MGLPPTTIKQTGRDRSGKIPRAQNWSNFYQSATAWAGPTLEDKAGPAYHSADGGEQIFPTPPYMSNRVLNGTANYQTDDMARGGGSGY